MPDSASAHRQCQPCTACCDGWVRMTIHGQDVYPGKPCVHSTGAGCNDYTNRPVDPCVKFACGWVIPQSPLPDWMQPNHSRTMVLFEQYRWRGIPVDLAVPVGRRIPGRALDWLKNFCSRHGRLLIYTEQIKENGQYSREQNYLAFGPQVFLQEVATWIERGVLR